MWHTSTRRTESFIDKMMHMENRRKIMGLTMATHIAASIMFMLYFGASFSKEFVRAAK